MISYTKTSVNVITFSISITIFILINLIFQSFKFINQTQVIQENISYENITDSTFEVEEKIEEITTWTIEIPAIDLKAEIAEGTEKETMDKYVGHFEDTARIFGNVGLAAHNRGYTVNYFADIKKLKKDDEIIYKYNENEKIYKVDKIEVIRDTDWTFLESTQENKITLITCVENTPEYRRCVQAIEKEENNENN